MAPQPNNLADQVWLDYTSDGVEHSLVYHVASATSQANIQSQATALANGLKSLMKTTDSFTGLRHRDSNSTFSFPLAFTAIAGTATATPEDDAEAKFLSITGRSLQGVRARVTFFSIALSDIDKFRVSTSTGLYTAVTGLAIPIVAKDGNAIVWNTYTNAGYNAYWQRQFRTQ